MPKPTKKIDPTSTVPADLQAAFAALGADFHAKTGAPFEDIQEFMVATIKLYVEYMEREETH